MTQIKLKKKYRLCAVYQDIKLNGYHFEKIADYTTVPNAQRAKEMYKQKGYISKKFKKQMPTGYAIQNIDKVKFNKFVVRKNMYNSQKEENN